MPKSVVLAADQLGFLLNACLTPRRLMNETVAVCTRQNGHAGKHWMEAPSWPRIEWANRLRRTAKGESTHGP